MAIGNKENLTLVTSSALLRNSYSYNGSSADLYPDAGIIYLSNGCLFNLGAAIGYFGRVFIIKNVDVAQSSFIDPFNTETIDGGSTYDLEFGKTILISPNTDLNGWEILLSR